MIALPIVLIVALSSFVALEIATLRRWKGWWRIWALLPIVALGLVVLNIIVGVTQNYTAHNLWPLEILVWSIGGLIFLGLLHLIHKTGRYLGIW